jgi:hypothetical protein
MFRRLRISGKSVRGAVGNALSICIRRRTTKAVEAGLKPWCVTGALGGPGSRATCSDDPEFSSNDIGDTQRHR